MEGTSLDLPLDARRFFAQAIYDVDEAAVVLEYALATTPKNMAITAVARFLTSSGTRLGWPPAPLFNTQVIMPNNPKAP